MRQQNKVPMLDKILFWLVAFIGLFSVGYAVKTKKDLNKEKYKNAKLQIKDIDSEARIAVSDTSLVDLVSESNARFRRPRRADRPKTRN